MGDFGVSKEKNNANLNRQDVPNLYFQQQRQRYLWVSPGSLQIMVDGEVARRRLLVGGEPLKEYDYLVLGINTHKQAQPHVIPDVRKQPKAKAANRWCLRNSY